MAKNLWNLENYPASFCFDNSEVQEWRDVKNITTENSNCANDCAENVFLTAHSVLEPNFDLGSYPQNESDLIEENLWMSLICFEVSAPFNVLVLTSIDGNVRVKAIDYIMKGERLRFKCEPEQESVKFNWKWMVQPIKSMVLQTCAVFNCKCYHCKSNENGNYFRLKNIVNRKSQPTTNLNVWEKKIDINFNCAENYKNEIFRRIPCNPFSINLNQELWDKTEQSCFQNQPDFSNSQPTMPSPQSKKSDEPTLDFDEDNPDGDYSKVIVKEEFMCNFCRRIFPNSHRLKIHLTKMHLPKMHKIRKKTTRKCNINRKSKFHNAHGKNNHLTCDECGRVMKTQRGFYLHKFFHLPREVRSNSEVTREKNNPISCEDCGKMMKDRRGLHIHKYYHLYQSARGARIHREFAVQKKSGHKIASSFTKLKVNEKTANLPQLKIVLEKLRLYPCMLCTKMFVKKSHLVDHEKDCSFLSEGLLKEISDKGGDEITDLLK